MGMTFQEAAAHVRSYGSRVVKPFAHLIESVDVIEAHERELPALVRKTEQAKSALAALEAQVMAAQERARVTQQELAERIARERASADLEVNRLHDAIATARMELEQTTDQLKALHAEIERSGGLAGELQTELASLRHDRDLLVARLNESRRSLG